MFDRLTALFEPSPRDAEGWLVRMERPVVSPRDRARFERWLDADPRRLDDYQALKTLARETRSLKAAFTAELATIPRETRRARRRAAWPAFAVPALGAVAALAVTVVVWPSLSPFGPRDPMAGAETFRTAVGEIRDVTLDDGSRVTLDTASVMRVRLDGSARRVVLDDGGAYFDVRHALDRPFQVALADRTVVVTGTRFATTLRDGDAEVALIEGAVSLNRAEAPDVAMRLAPGDRVVYRAGQPARRLARRDPAGTALWRERRLVFRDAPLSEVLAELSRYTDVRIVAADPGLGKKRVTAVFPLEGTESVPERIDRLFPVSVAAVGPGRVEVRAD